jgi:hypothetical protein
MGAVAVRSVSSHRRRRTRLICRTHPATSASAARPVSAPAGSAGAAPRIVFQFRAQAGDTANRFYLSLGLGRLFKMKRCNRFGHDGSACTNKTDNADGWCREPGCPGFRRPDPSRAPESAGNPSGTPKHIRETGGLSLGDITVEDIAYTHVTTRAIDSFRFHHGGGEREAEVQLRSMLEDFLLKSARRKSIGGFLVLSRDGYDLTLSPSGNGITGYSTVHRERTWEQVKAGVKSRIRAAKARPPSGPPPEPGPAVELSDFGVVFDPASVHLTGRVRTSYAGIAGLKSASNEELDAAIRAASSEFTSGSIDQRADGCFEVSVADRTWLISPDCRLLVGVKSRETL